MTSDERRLENARDYYKDLLEQTYIHIAELCRLAGADPDLPADAWTLKEAICRLIDRAEGRVCATLVGEATSPGPEDGATFDAGPLPRR